MALVATLSPPCRIQIDEERYAFVAEDGETTIYRADYDGELDAMREAGMFAPIAAEAH